MEVWYYIGIVIILFGLIYIIFAAAQFRRGTIGLHHLSEIMKICRTQYRRQRFIALAIEAVGVLVIYIPVWGTG